MSSDKLCPPERPPKSRGGFVDVSSVYNRPDNLNKATLYKPPAPTPPSHEDTETYLYSPPHEETETYQYLTKPQVCSNISDFSVTQSHSKPELPPKLKNVYHDPLPLELSCDKDLINGGLSEDKFLFIKLPGQNLQMPFMTVNSLETINNGVLDLTFLQEDYSPNEFIADEATIIRRLINTNSDLLSYGNVFKVENYRTGAEFILPDAFSDTTSYRSVDIADLETDKVGHDATEGEQPRSELIWKIDKRIRDSEDKKREVISESIKNDEVGRLIEEKLSAMGSSSEIEKYRSQVEDVEKITSLLFCLSVRLARVENSDTINNTNKDTDEMSRKKERLLDQLEEAKILKKNIERKTTTVSDIVAKHLGFKELERFKQFLTMKKKLIIELRELSDRIQLNKDQLKLMNK